MHKEVEQAYRKGFSAKCAEVGVDPAEVVKAAQLAGGLGGAALGGAIGALRRPADKRRPVRARLVNMLKGMLVGGGLGALGEVGLNRYAAKVRPQNQGARNLRTELKDRMEASRLAGKGTGSARMDRLTAQAKGFREAGLLDVPRHRQIAEDADDVMSGLSRRLLEKLQRAKPLPQAPVLEPEPNK